LVAVFFLFVGYARLGVVDKMAVENYAATYMGKEVSFYGTILDEPDIRQGKVQYTLSRIILDDSKKKFNGKILVTTRLYPRYAFLDRLHLRCTLEKPKAFNGFAYDAYLAKDGIYALCNYPSYVQVDKQIVTHLWPDQIKKYIFLIKNNFIVHISQILPAPHAGLLAGLLVGEIGTLPLYLKQAFIDTGTIHIVAISGFNIMIIVSLFLNLAPYFYIPRKTAWIIIIPALFAFVIMVGGEASVVRAAIMAIIVAAATEGGRLGDMRRVLLATAFIMLLINPYLLRFDAGFQLSFLATIGLLYIAPLLDKGLRKAVQTLLARLPRIRSISSKGGNFFKALGGAATTTIGANIAVAPVLLWNFGRVSLISPLVNVLILWVIPFAMAIGFFAVIVSYLFLPAASVIGFAVWVLLEYIIKVVQFFSHIQ
jgi:competence protein ComEC